MVKTVIRRQGDPQAVQHLWEAVTFIRNQRQVANQERIGKFMTRQYGYSQGEWKKELAFTVQDELLVKEISTGKKGIRAGLEQEAFWCVTELKGKSTEKHDWYCFTCHKSGRMWCCSSCHRVYHPRCINEEQEVVTANTSWSCAVCQSLQRKKFIISKNVLSRLLNFVLARMKDKAKELHKSLNLDTLPNYHNLVFRHVDLGTIIQRVQKNKYRHLEDFEIAAQNMVHTSAVYYGLDSNRTDLCQLTLKDCRYDLAEIRLCVDCYLSSNNKVGQDWFCRPCYPPHEIAWVHMRGFGFWPAKILCRNEGKVDVRFFGKRHERALVPAEDVKDIHTDLKKLRVKQSKGWKSAHSEMLMHRRLTEEDAKMDHKRGHKRGHEASEAEEFVKRSHSDAGQVNSISTSQEYSHHHSDNNPNKRLQKDKGSSSSSSQIGVKHEMDVDQEFPVFQETEDVGDIHQGTTSSSSPPPPPPPRETQEKSSTTPSTSGGKKRKEKSLPKNPAANSPGGVGKGGERRPGRDGPQNDPEKKKQATDICGASKREGENSTGRKDGEGQRSKGENQIEKMTLEQVRREEAKTLQERIEKAVEETLSAARKDWQKQMATAESKRSTERQESLKDSRKEQDKLKEAHEKEVTELKDKYKKEISQTKKRQWCINCEQEAMYHCCWNTSYCSITCQQMHWHKEHKRLCRRKRN